MGLSMKLFKSEIDSQLLLLPNNLYYYIKLSKERKIFLSEDVTLETSTSLSSLLLYYDSIDHSPITIYINTNGGDLSALLNIYDIMQIIQSPIETICVGKAYSAGSLILAAGTHRKMYKHAKVMIHGIQCVFPIPTENDPTSIENYFDYLNINNQNVAKILAKHTGFDLQFILDDLKNDKYFSAEQALEYRLIDEIL